MCYWDNYVYQSGGPSKTSSMISRYSTKEFLSYIYTSAEENCQNRNYGTRYELIPLDPYVRVMKFPKMLSRIADSRTNHPDLADSVAIKTPFGGLSLSPYLASSSSSITKPDHYTPYAFFLRKTFTRFNFVIS